MRCNTRTATPAGVCPPWRSRSSWPLKVWLIDSMTCRSGRKQVRASPLGLALAGRAQQPHAQPSQRRLELAAVVVLVGDQGLAGPGGHQGRISGQDAQQHLALVGFGAGQREGDRQAVQGADQVQPQPPEPARVAGPVAVGGPAGQLRPFGGLPGAAALHRGGIGDPHVIGPPAGVGGQQADDPPEQVGRPTQALVVAGLLG